MSALPLDGVTVIDLTHAAAGPSCTMILGNFGAKVIKIEKPGRGDGSRHMRMRGGPPDFEIGSDYYLGVNADKHSVGLDLGTERGRAIAADLIAAADVLVQNFRPGVLDSMGLDYAAMAARNPGLIYCDVSAFPLDSPLRDAPGMDIVAQAQAGTIYCTGHPGGEPVKPGPSLADMSCGLQATIGVLLALRVREQTGKGQRVGLNLYHSTLLMLANYASVVLNDPDQEIEPMGSGHPQLSPYQAFPTADRWIFIAVGTNQLWTRLCDAIQQPGLADDDRFHTNGRRVDNRQDLVPLLSDLFRQQSSNYWLELLAQAGVPASPIVGPGDAFRSELERGAAITATVDHPDYGPTNVTGVSIELSETPGSVRKYPPRLGDDTNAILAEILGYDDDEIMALKAAGVIRQYGVD